MTIKQFNFNDTIRAIPQKTLSSSVLSQKDLLMIKLIVTDSRFAGTTSYPYKYLPVMYTCDELSNGGLEGIVLPKGTIVSLLTNQSTGVTDGMALPSASGVIEQYESQISGGWITTPIDDAFFGYDESVTSLLVPANGGSASSIPYSLLDDEVGSYNVNGDPALTIGANIPMGIVMEPIFQDIRGRNLNYQTHDVATVVDGGRFDIPFVDTTKITNFGSCADIANAAKGYTAVWRKWQFLAFGAETGRSGAYLKSDLFGKFIVEDATEDAVKSIQTVGKIVSLDCRFPKELSAMIQHYPGMRLMGVATAGVPTELFAFAYAVQVATSGATDATSILNLIRAGAYGYARISLEL